MNRTPGASHAVSNKNMAVPSNKLLSVQNPKSIVGAWIFTFLWCGISFTVFWAFAFQARDIVGGSIGGLFSLLGLVMLYGSVKMTLEYGKYGQVQLALEGDPPATGRSFSARLDLPGDAGTAATIHAELACVQATWTRGSKGGLSLSERDAWTRKNVFPVRRGAASGHATLKFDVPVDQPASDLPGEERPDIVLQAGHPAGIEAGRSYYRWELRVKADVPGIDLERTFKLRVAPAPQGAAARPGAAVRPAPVLDPKIEGRIATRRAAERKLSAWSAFIGFAPFVAPFAIAGLAVGLAGCPMSWSTGNPPRCEFAGMNWGPLMSGAFDLMFIAVPAGIAGSILFYLAGQWWLSRNEPQQSAATAVGVGGVLVGLAMLGGFLYKAGFLDGLMAKDSRKPPQREQKRAAALEASPSREMTASRPEPAFDRDSPFAQAVALYRQSQAHERQKQIAEQEKALLSALEILEQHPPGAAREALGTEGAWLDKEVVARRLGDFYWDRRRYDKAYDYYDRAYRYVPEIEASEFERNRRLARNSAGRMAGACTQGDWDVADSAMKELKERIENVDAETRKQLEYWIRTGEPRLAARKC